MSAPDPRALAAILKEASALARSRSVAQVQTKSAQDYVTDIDVMLDSLLQDKLAPLAPGCPVLSEERAVAPDLRSDGYWIIDPLDGTGNVVAGLPFSAISVAFVDARGPLVAAVVSIHEGRIWSAVRGQGAWLDDQPLRLPEQPSGDLIVASTGLMDRLFSGPGGVEVWQALRRIGKLRNLGAQALHLCGAASGRFVAVLSVEARIWDEAAGGLILREAGGSWTSAADAADWSNPPQVMGLAPRLSIACHTAVRPALLAALKGDGLPFTS